MRLTVDVRLAEAVVAAGRAYAAVGIAFALAFVVRGVRRIDPSAAAGTIGFRALIVPGVAALWPLLAWRWLRATGEVPQQHDAHTDAAPREGRRP